MPPQDGAPQTLTLPDFADGALEAPVPGDVNAILLANGRIADPHYDCNARQCYWVTAREWWYVRDFDLPGADVHTDLCVDGADSTADVWVNGHYLATLQSLFHPYRMDLAGLAMRGTNRVVVRFRSINQLLGGSRLDELAGWKSRRGFLRKPMYNFGWDWALPLPSLGLTGGVWLEREADCRILEHSVHGLPSGRVDFKFHISDGVLRRAPVVRLVLEGQGEVFRKEMAMRAHKWYDSFQLEHPRLWWPNGAGEQPLYGYQITLLDGDTVLDERIGRIGLRSAAAVEEPFTPDAGHGIAFWLEINGVRTFCKGGNWIPMELWPATVRPEDYGFYLRKAKEAGFNMLRIWGGGIYENDRFYELCDELGIMVWQDFMLASTGYPLERLREEILLEAEYQVKRLRCHPSVVLWCGINEDINSWAYQGMASGGQQDSGVYSEADTAWAVDRNKVDNELFGILLRGAAQRYGLGTPYVESSPASWDDIGNLPTSGNCHISCWKYALFETGGQYARFREHFEQPCSFDSEFCIQGPSSVRMIRSFLRPENHWPPNDAWIYHVQRGHANIPHYEQTLAIAGGIFGPIDTLEQYVRHGQATHVEMMRSEFESARRDWPNNGGTMMWMYNDCWPTSNWSIIDYHKDPKPSYYAAKRACAPLLPIIFARAGQIEFLFSNHCASAVRLKARYGQQTLDGTVLWDKTAEVTVSANAAGFFDTLPLDAIQASPDRFLFLQVKADGQALDTVTYFPWGWREVPWPQPEARAEIIEQGRTPEGFRATVRVRAGRYLRLGHLRPAGEKAFWASDNYFDLLAGETKLLTLTSAQPLDLQGIRLRSWLDSWE